EAFAYIAAHPEIRDVIVSGGDALMLGDDKLARVLACLRQIPHVDVVRLATRMPIFVPERVTSDLLALLRAHAPVFVLLHTNHPRELSEGARAALTRLVDGGVPVLNQTVLLRGV